MPEDGNSETISGEAAGALASHQVGLALERNRMGADRTLMAMMWTSWAAAGYARSPG